MTFKDYIKKLLTTACVYFTLVMLVYMIIAAIMNVNDDKLLLEAGRTVLFFFFSMLWAAANTILSIKQWGMGLRISLHYILMLLAFFLFLLLPLANLSAPGYLIGFVMFSAIYAATMGIIHLFKSKYKTNVESTEQYKQQYPKKK